MTNIKGHSWFRCFHADSPDCPGRGFRLLALIVAVGFVLKGRRAISADARLQPQARTELTLKLDNSVAPVIATRDLFPALRDGLREPRIGFATITPAADAIEVTLADGVDRTPALTRLHELARPPGANTDNFTVAEVGGAVVR